MTIYTYIYIYIYGSKLSFRKLPTPCLAGGRCRSSPRTCLALVPAGRRAVSEGAFWKAHPKDVPKVLRCRETKRRKRGERKKQTCWRVHAERGKKKKIAMLRVHVGRQHQIGPPWFLNSVSDFGTLWCSRPIEQERPRNLFTTKNGLPQKVLSPGTQEVRVGIV